MPSNAPEPRQPFERGLNAGLPPVSPEHLLGLVRRIARRDRPAFVELYDALSGQVFDEAHCVVPDLRQAAAITACSFVEVWSLARFHTATGTDVSAWLAEISGRRIADRQTTGAAGEEVDPVRPRVPARRQLWWSVVADTYDRQMARALAALLGQPVPDRAGRSPVGADPQAAI